MRAELCRQTVTLYHRSGQTVTRTVLRGVFVQQGRRQKPDAAGAKAGTMLFLVIPAACGTPGTDYTLEPGRVIRANCYKCGDKTVREHYMMWNPTTSDTPDFHRPQDFGEMEMA